MSLTARMPGWLRELRLRALALLIANHDSAAVIDQEIRQSVWFEGALETKTQYDI